MTFIIFLDITETKKKAIIPDKTQTDRRRKRRLILNPPSKLSIVAAAPVLILLIVYKETNEKAMTRVFVLPRRVKNPFLSDFMIVFPIIAA